MFVGGFKLVITGGMQFTREGSWLGGRGEQGRMVIVVRNNWMGRFYEEIILQRGRRETKDGTIFQ